MKFTKQQLSLIKEYVMDELTKERKALFDENMKSEDFRKEVFHELSIVSAIQESANRSLKNSILSFDKEIVIPAEKEVGKRKESGNSSTRFWRYAMAGVFVVAICCLFFLFSKGQNDVAYSYAAMYEAYPASESTRGKVEQENKAASEAMEFYRKGEYAKALAGFEALSATVPSYDIYKAICYIELEQDSNAKSALTNLINSEDLETKQVAEWYNSLLLLKTGKTIEFESAFEKILNDESHLFHDSAKEATK